MGRGKPPPGRASEARRRSLAYLYWLFRNAPEPVSRAHVVALKLLLHAAAVAPGNPVLRSCRAIRALAPGTAGGRGAVGIHRAFVNQLGAAAAGYLAAVRRGPAVLEEWVHLPQPALERIDRLRTRSRGLMIAVPHNVGGILGSARLARELPTMVLARNSTSAGRDRMMVELFERLGVEILLTRSTHVAGLFRSCIRALRRGTVVVATLDNIDPGRKSRLEVPVFGGALPMPTWGARIAARAGAPVLPGWVGHDGRRFGLTVGEPRADADPERLVTHYMAWFEERILQDPASWLFLGHKRWATALEAAARRRARAA
jgi:lauroyl/myristoyl acyltransferase